MRILVTAGNTQSPIDRVRCITNVFSGRTGAAIALEAAARGHAVVLATSHPDTAAGAGFPVLAYRTFDDLEALMAGLIPGGRLDAVVCAAAVNDYHVAGTFAKPGDRPLDPAGKLRGNHPELWLKLVPAPKLIDKVRAEWAFAGTLVKFKLEVGATDAELAATAEKSRRHSRADLMVANTLDGMKEWALVGAGHDYAKVPRAALPAAVLDRLERGGFV